MQDRRAYRALLLAGVFLSLGQVAHAQDATPADEGEGSTLKTVKTDEGSIIVTAKRYVPVGALTASKTSIPLIETPQSVSVITRDQIDLLNFTDAQQAVRYTAGVFGENYGPDPRFDFVTVRGFLPKYYVDGLASPATTTIQASGLDLYAFQSLDVLKGPASVLYGSAPPGGILNETARRPSDTFGGEIHAKYGSFKYAEIAGTATGAATDYLSLRFTGLIRDNDGIVDHSNNKRVLVAPSATFKLGPTTKITLLGYYQYDDDTGGGQGGFLPVIGTLFKNPNGQIKRSTNLHDPLDEYERRQSGLGWDFEQKFGAVATFHSNTKWTRYSEHTPIGLYSGLGGWVQNDLANPDDPSNFTTLARYNFSYAEKVTSFATDNRVDATVDTGAVRQKLLVGLDYRNVHNLAKDNFLCQNQDPVSFACLDTINVFAPVYPAALQQAIGYPFAYNDERLKQTGLYGQDQIKLGHVYATLSGRYDWVKIADSYFGGAIVEADQHKFTWRAGLSYITDSGIAPYMSYATSFEPLLGIDSDTGKALKPTSAKQWEGGVKFDGRRMPDDFKIFATAAAYDIRQSNFTVAQAGITPLNTAQGGLVEVYGGELEVVARIRQQLSINGSLSYTHSEIKSTPTLATAADIGAPMPVTPKLKASLFVDYNVQKGPLAGAGFGFGVRHSSRSAGSLPSAYGVVYYGPATTLFDGILSYDMPGWRIAVNGSNIFDKKYVARCDGPFGCVYGAGRQVIGTVTKKF